MLSSLQGYGKPVGSGLCSKYILEVRTDSGFYRVLLKLGQVCGVANCTHWLLFLGSVPFLELRLVLILSHVRHRAWRVTFHAT